MVGYAPIPTRPDQPPPLQVQDTWMISGGNQPTLYPCMAKEAPTASCTTPDPRFLHADVKAQGISPPVMDEARYARQMGTGEKDTLQNHTCVCNSWTFRSIPIATPRMHQVDKQLGMQASTFVCVLRIPREQTKLHPSSGAECGCTHKVIPDSKILFLGRPRGSSLDALSSVISSVLL